MLNPDFERAVQAARHFRSIGLVPLPSCMDKKRPMLPEFKHFRSVTVPEAIYDERSWKTTNLQLMCGVETSGAIKITVVDLDGPEALEAWHAICAKHNYTLKSNSHHPWIASTGSGGTHLYYRLPDGITRSPSRLVWGLYDTLTGWVKHREIRLLGDGSLAVAPPSVRVDGIGSYTWHGRYSPWCVPLPEVAPDWLVSLPGVLAPQRQSYDEPKAQNVQRSHDGSLREKILARIPAQQKVEIARSWGLRFQQEHPRVGCGWIPCHAVDREDVTPSSGFDASTGVYHDFHNTGPALSFFDLAVALGAYRTWQETMDDLAKKVGIT
jgi:hypothetical protein